MNWYGVARGLIVASLLGGAAAQAQILIGQTAGFTGPVASGAKETTDGARLYIDSINAKGGVHGQRIELLSLDDKFDPKLAAENARQLIEVKQVLALFLNCGTPHTEAIQPGAGATRRAADRPLDRGHGAAPAGQAVHFQRPGDVPARIRKGGGPPEHQRAGKNPSREKLRTALEGIRNFNLGCLEVGYGPDDHTGLEFVDLSIGADGRFMR